ncbi:MAG: histidine phosphatase family protein [Desulfobacterales bacterium]|jgi:probable phosphoglycerate mutase
MQDPYEIIRFGLIRHAQTIWNREKKIQGQSDSPLTTDGERQASNWGPILLRYSWDRILASDADRALATGERINAFLKIPIEIDSRLREQDWGHWVGKTVAQIQAESAELLDEQTSAGWDFCPPGGEDRKSVMARSREALRDAFSRWPGENILVVTHEGVIKSLLYYLSGRKFLPAEPPLLKSYHLHLLAHDRDGLRLEAVNWLTLAST